ncbi:MAG: DnaD domain protein [Chloroflexota bacterium]
MPILDGVQRSDDDGNLDVLRPYRAWGTKGRRDMTGGFPNTAAGTVIPNAFFSAVLPDISDPAELIVSIYVFYALGQKRRHPRFVTLRELEADAGLARSLEAIASSEAESPLARGLALAIRRETLVQATTDGETLFTANMPANRRALERLAADGVRIEAPLPPANGERAANIFSLYEDNIGSITPLISDELKEAEGQYSAQWIEDAFREAAELNKRSWRYVRTILQRWETEGRHEELRRDPEADWLARRYREGKRPPARTTP